MKNKKYLLAILAIIILIGFVLFFSRSFNNFNFRNILGNVADIDVPSLKAWQQNSGFRRNFALNDKGSDLKLLQKALSTDSLIYPEQKVTGRLDENTSRALSAFQKENNLPETGVFDLETRKKMNDIFYKELCPVQTAEYPDFTDFVFNKNENKLPDDFIPKDLKKITEGGVKSMGGVICLRADALESLKQMFDVARAEGMDFAVTSGFRKPAVQEWLVNYYYQAMGEKGLRGIALPGYSEHGLGTAVDLTAASVNYRGTESDFQYTREYKWLKENAGQYGFRLSYPKGNTEYIYEPWHWRFWGIGR